MPAQRDYRAYRRVFMYNLSRHTLSILPALPPVLLSVLSLTRKPQFCKVARSVGFDNEGDFVGLPGRPEPTFGSAKPTDGIGQGSMSSFALNKL